MKQFVVGLPSELKKLMYLHAGDAKDLASMVEKCQALLKIEGGPGAAACARVSTEETKLDMVLRRMDSLSDEMATLRMGGGPPQVNAVQARQNRGPFKFNGSCYKCNGFGHMARDCPQRSSGNCGICKNPGHSARDCALQVKARCGKCLNSGHSAANCSFKGDLNWQ